MTWPRRFAVALLLAASPWLPSLRLAAQVVHVAGYGSSIDGVEGASLTRYDENATSSLSLGAAQGIHLGVSREVASGPARLTLGDSHPSLALPSDPQEGERSVYANGALLQVGSVDRNVQVFAGRSGQNFGNAFFSGVSGEHTMLLSSASMRTGRVSWHALTLRGERHAMIASARFHLRPQTRLALSAGMCAGRPVLRATFRHTAPTWHLEVNDTSGHLQLQPQRNLQLAQLERIGLNVSASKRIHQRLSLDAARHEYATGIADLPDAPSTIGPRSVLLEAGATASTGAFQSGIRLLTSSSAGAQDHAIAWIEGWHDGDTSLMAMVLRRTDPHGATGTTLQLDAGRRVNRHLQLQAGLLLGNGSPSADAGGTLQGNWGSLTVSHSETYLPFGTQTGFRRVLTLALRLHVHNADVSLAHLSATGITSAWQGSISDFETAGDPGEANTPSHARLSLPRYRLQGTVLNGTTPIPGAAVAVGNQLVYTDADGHWLARFPHDTPVRIALQPSEFLTGETYRAQTEPRIQSPAADAPYLELHAERCRPADLPQPSFPRPDAEPSHLHRHTALRTLARFALQAVRLWSAHPQQA